MTKFVQRGQRVSTQYNAEKIIIHPHHDDPYAEYLQRLYDWINGFLEQTLQIISGDNQEGELIIPLRFKHVPNVLNPEQESVPQLDPLTAIIGKRYAGSSDNFDNLRDAFLAFKGRLLLLGEPGAGKTISLLLFAQDSILRRVKDPSQPLPILGIVPTWNYKEQPSIAEWLQSSFNAPNNVKEILNSGKGLLLLDGLDELFPDDGDTRDPQLFFVQKLPKDNQIVLTCRTHTIGFLAGEINLRGTVALSPLTETQIFTYLSAFPSLLDMVSNNEIMKKMLNTPIMLAFFTEAYHDIEDQNLIRSDRQFDIHNDIMDTCIRQRYQRAASSLLPLDATYSLLGMIAFEIMSGAPFFDRTRIKQEIIHQIAGDQEQVFIRQAVQLRILLQVDKDVYRFSHLFFRDFFTFQYCIQYIPMVSRSYRGEQRLVYLTHSLDYANRALFGENNYYRDAIINECAKILCTSEIPSLSSPLSDKRFGAMLVLSAFGEAATETFSMLLDNPKSHVRYDAVYALCQNKKSFTIPLLIKALDDTDVKVKLHSINGLKEIGEIQAIEPLIKQLDSTNPRVSVSAAEAIVSFGEGALNYMVLAAKTADSQSLQNALQFIKNEQHKEAIPSLLLALDSNDDLKAAIILAIIGDENVTKQLIQYLPEQKELDEQWILWLLTQLGKRNLSPLVELLNDSNSELRAIAVMLLREISNEDAIAPLLAKLNDPDEQIQFMASMALAQFEESVLDELLPQVFSNNQLEVLDENSFIEAVIDKMREVSDTEVNSNHFILITLLAALGRLIGEKIPLVIDSLGDAKRTDNEQLNSLIVNAIVGMEAAAFEHLFTALQHSDEHIRITAAYILEYHGIDLNQ